MTRTISVWPTGTPSPATEKVRIFPGDLLAAVPMLRIKTAVPTTGGVIIGVPALYEPMISIQERLMPRVGR